MHFRFSKEQGKRHWLSTGLFFLAFLLCFGSMWVEYMIYPGVCVGHLASFLFGVELMRKDKDG